MPDFAAAVAVTNSGGDIIALDSGGYGPFTINKAVTIQPVPGAYAGISPASGDGITINALAADAVVIRDLNLAGLGAANGINFNTGKSLHVENCSINGFSSSGIDCFVSMSSKLYVRSGTASTPGSSTSCAGSARLARTMAQISGARSRRGGSMPAPAACRCQMPGVTRRSPGR